MLLARKCAWCQATGVKLPSCAKCCLVAYCGRDCQKKHWKTEHRASCCKTNVDLTFCIEAHRAGQARKLDGDSSAENISMDLFLKMTPEAQSKAIVKFAAATRPVRKYKKVMTDASLRWAAISETSRLVLMHMSVDDWHAADKCLRAFFRLVKKFDMVESSQTQRDTWGLYSHIENMTKNRCVVREILLEAEVVVTRKHVWLLAPGPDKSQQTYALAQRIMLTQQHYAKLGRNYEQMNMFSRIETIILCVCALVDLGCTKDAVDNGVELNKTFALLDYQVALGFTVLASADEDYPERVEQVSTLQRMVGIVERMKDSVHHSRFAASAARYSVEIGALLTALPLASGGADPDSDSDSQED